MTQFVAAGSPRAVARAIEEYAAAQRTVTAIVVPWESDETILRMSVTAAAGEGWAIEHANLGTIALTGVGTDQTRVDAVPDEKKERAVLFDRFAQQLRGRLQGVA